MPVWRSSVLKGTFTDTRYLKIISSITSRATATSLVMAFNKVTPSDGIGAIIKPSEYGMTEQ